MSSSEDEEDEELDELDEADEEEGGPPPTPPSENSSGPMISANISEGNAGLVVLGTPVGTPWTAGAAIECASAGGGGGAGAIGEAAGCPTLGPVLFVNGRGGIVNV